MTGKIKSPVLDAKTNLLASGFKNHRERKATYTYTEQNAEIISYLLKQKQSYAGTGNRCGHNPAVIRPVVLPKAFKRPIIIQKLLQALRRTNTPKKLFPHLKRSEGVESVIQLLEKLLYNLELSTMTVCNNDITFSKPRLADLTQDAPITALSFSRAKRAQHKLVKMGCLKVIRSPKYKNGEFRADPSVREITPKLWIKLGLGSEYAVQMHYKQKRLDKRHRKHYRKMQFRHIFEAKAKKTATVVSFSPSVNDKQRKEKLLALYLNLYRQKNPDSLNEALFVQSARKMEILSLEKALRHYDIDTS